MINLYRETNSKAELSFPKPSFENIANPQIISGTK